MAVSHRFISAVCTQQEVNNPCVWAPSCIMRIAMSAHVWPYMHGDPCFGSMRGNHLRFIICKLGLERPGHGPARA